MFPREETWEVLGVFPVLYFFSVCWEGKGERGAFHSPKAPCWAVLCS